MRPTISAQRFLSGGLVLALAACGKMPDDGDGTSRQAAFTEAVPTIEQMGVEVPGEASAITTRSVSELATERVAEAKLYDLVYDGAARAVFYTFTRDMSHAINGGVLGLLVVIKAIAESPPSKVTETHRYWGPWTGALEPLTYAFAMDVEQQNDIKYALFAKPKNTADSSYRVILFGNYHPQTPGQGEGALVFDANAARELDPMGSHDRGRVAIHWNNFVEPRTVEVAFQEFADKQGADTFSALYRYREARDTSGTFEFLVHGDLDDGKDPAKLAKENLAIVSRWTSGGAGRSDVVVTGGDLPVPSVYLQECWNDVFERVYYTDDRGVAPTEGDAGSCAMPAPGK